MSVHVSSRVWLLRGIPPTHKLVLLKLADCADDTGHNAFPSVATIADEAGASERTVQRVLRDLVAWGFITVERDATSRRPTVYSVTPEKGVRGDSLSPQEGCQSDTPEALRGDMDVTPGVTPRRPRGDTGVTRSVSDPSDDPSDPDSAPAREESGEGVRIAFAGLKAAGIEVTAMVAEAVVERVDGGTPGEWIREAAKKTALAGVKHWNYVAKVLDGWGKDGPPAQREQATGGRHGRRRDEGAWDLAELDPTGELQRNGVLIG